MSGSTTKAKNYLVKCLQTKQPISFVKDAAKDLANYGVRYSSTFTSDMKSEFLSKIFDIFEFLAKYITTLPSFIFTLDCLFLNHFFCLTL